MHLFPSKRPFLVVVLNTHTKTAKFITPTAQLPRPVQISSKFDFLLCLGVHSQLTIINYASFPIFFSALVGAHAPNAPLATPVYINLAKYSNFVSLRLKRRVTWHKTVILARMFYLGRSKTSVDDDDNNNTTIYMAP